MIAAVLIPLVMAGGTPEPIDPATEVLVVQATWDPAICPVVETVVPLVGSMLGDYELALEMVVAWSVEEYEDGYGQNLTEEGELALIELIEDCL